MKFFAKAICNRAQVENRIGWNADGIELYLKCILLHEPSFRDLLKFASDNFERVNLEVGDRISQDPLIPADLLGEKTMTYAADALELLQRIPNGNKLIMHLAAACDVVARPTSTF